MIRKYVLTILAMAGVAMAIFTVRTASRATPVAAPVVEPAQSPFQAHVAGTGIVEASTRNIAIGTPVSGLVSVLHVEAGDEVTAGEPLFRLDDRELTAQLAVKQATLDATKAQLEKLLASPRPEDIPPAEARVLAAQTNLADLQQQLSMWESVTDKRAVVQEELDRRRFAVQAAEARLSESQAELALLKAGAWQADIDIARAQVASAEAEVKQVKTDLDRLIIRAPVNGQVLQCNVRAGEFAAAGALETPLLLLGDINTLHVRVDVDENDAWRVRANAPAVGYLRGNPNLKTNLMFVRFEPYVVPKRSLTGASTERVDTRVLQVIYSFKRGDLPVYVGQLLDVSIEAPPIAPLVPDEVAMQSKAQGEDGAQP